MYNKHRYNAHRTSLSPSNNSALILTVTPDCLAITTTLRTKILHTKITSQGQIVLPASPVIDDTVQIWLLDSNRIDAKLDPSSVSKTKPIIQQSKTCPQDQAFIREKNIEDPMPVTENCLQDEISPQLQ